MPDYHSLAFNLQTASLHTSSSPMPCYKFYREVRQNPSSISCSLYPEKIIIQQVLCSSLVVDHIPFLLDNRTHISLVKLLLSVI